MYRIFLGIVFLFSSMFLKAQNITVIGSDSMLSIKGVSISNKDKSIIVYTDNKGVFDLSVFENQKNIFLYHYQYLKKKQSISSLKENDTIILNKITEKLDEIVLSVSKGKENRDRIAEQTVVFTEEDIQKQSPQTSADLLASSPSVKVQKSQFGGGSPVLRGMEANRVLLVVDGVRMNNAIYRKGHLQNTITVSPNILERVEILFGPSSVIYGSDALGGVIHYYTKSLRTSETKDVNTSAFTRYSSVNNEFTTQFDTELSFQKWASYTNISYSNFGDLRMGKNRSHGYADWGKVFEYSDNSETVTNPNSVVNSTPSIQKNTGYSQKDILQKFYFPVSNDIELLFNFQYSESSNIPRFDRLTEISNGNLKFAEWSYGPQKRFLFSTQLKLEEVNNWIDDGTITIAFQDVNESRVQRKFSSINERSHRKENVNVFSLNADFKVALTENKNKNLSYGYEAVYNKVKSNSLGENLFLNTNFNVQSRYPDGGSDYLTQALYVGYRQDLNKKQTLNTGIRYTNTQLNAHWIDQSFIKLPDSIISLKNSSLTANIAHIYKPSKNFNITTVLSSGFRSPNVDDIGKIREKNGRVTVPNINLKPEFAYNAEFGLIHYFNNRLFHIGMNAYYTLLDNYIIRAPYDIQTQSEGSSTIVYEGETVDVLSNVNRGTAFIRGGTISFRGEISKHWFASGSTTYTEGKTKDTKEALSSIPPLFGNLSLGFKGNKFETAFRYEFNLEKKPSDYNINEGIDNIEQTPILDANATSELDTYAGTPAWNTLNFRFLYEINSNVDFQFRIDNIFDKHYKEFASAISSPGRNFSTSVRYLF